MKLKLALLLILLCSLNCFSQGDTTYQQVILKKGITLGSVLAVVTSWDRNKSVLWAIPHAFLGWFYVGYYVFTRE